MKVPITTYLLYVWTFDWCSQVAYHHFRSMYRQGFSTDGRCVTVYRCVTVVSPFMSPFVSPLCHRLCHRLSLCHRCVTVYRNTLRSAVLGVHGSSWMCTGCGGSRSWCTLTCILEPQRAILPGSNPPWKGWIYYMAPEAPLFRGMPTGPEAFLEPLGASGLRPCARSLLKKALCHTRLVGRTVVSDLPLP